MASVSTLKAALDGGRQTVATLGATGRQHLAATTCFVTSTEAEFAGAL